DATGGRLFAVTPHQASTLTILARAMTTTSGAATCVLNRCPEGDRQSARGFRRPGRGTSARTMVNLRGHVVCFPLPPQSLIQVSGPGLCGNCSGGDGLRQLKSIL